MGNTPYVLLGLAAVITVIVVIVDIRYEFREIDRRWKHQQPLTRHRHRQDMDDLIAENVSRNRDYPYRWNTYKGR